MTDFEIYSGYPYLPLGSIEAVKRCDILLSLLHDTVDRDVLTANPNLKAVSSMNITQDRIDLAAATELGIPVATGKSRARVET